MLVDSVSRRPLLLRRPPLRIDHMILKEWSRLLAVCLVLCGLSRKATANNYTTSFPLTENPISENSNWINGMVAGIDWSNVVTSSGMAYGTQTGNNSGLGEYGDSTSLLTGAWGSNQTVQATVKILAADSAYEEVELRLRQTLSAHSCTGYEVTFSIRSNIPYVQVVRWNGPLGNFSYVDENDSTDYVKDGDVVKATIVGSTISVYKNGILLFTCADSTYSSGNPGMGFFLYGQGTSSNYGFSSFSATDGGTNLALPLVTLSELATNPIVNDSNPLSGGTNLTTITLAWSTVNATNVTLSGFGIVPLNGTTNASVSQTTTYTVTAKGANGTASTNITVIVPGPPTGLKTG
jgi:hypothetical protein